MEKWQWKEKDGSSGGLLYEPGNWGDIIKGEWLLQLLHDPAFATGLCRSYLDPFAGMLEYPASCGCRERLALLPESLFLPQAVRAYLDRGVWPAACTLAADCLPIGAAKLKVYDKDERRRLLLAESERFLVVGAGCGYELLASAEPHGLVLVDPYDFLAEWHEMLPRVLGTAQRSPLLLYVYNRAGRSRAQMQEYRRFRGALRKEGQSAWWGRVAADPFLPDCWHEMFFFPAALSHTFERENLAASLQTATLRINEALYRAGIFGRL